MNTPLSWIKDYVPELECTDKEYYDKMTLSGTKVESWERLDKNCEKIVVGRVESIEKHPDAEHLWVCEVNIGKAYEGNYTKETDGQDGKLPCCIQICTSAQNLVKGAVVPVCLNGGRVAGGHDGSPLPEGVGKKFRMTVLILGVAGLLFVPVFKAWTGLPPYLGIMISLGILWVVTEIVYNHKTIVKEERKQRVSRVIHNIDLPTILFFLGILMAVAGLQSVGILSGMAQWLDTNVHEVFTITGVVGVLSSIVDNVPLVAACMGMYPIADAASIAASADPAYMSMFVQDGLFWELLTYCAGVGGSMLIIGSAAGVVAMGLDKINFVWYLKKITWMAFLGYVAGIGVIYLQTLIF